MSRDHSANFKMKTKTQTAIAEPVAAMVVGSGPWLALRELLGEIEHAQRHFDGLATDKKRYRACKAAEERGLCEYLGEYEVCDGDGFLTGENAATFGLTEAGRAFLANTAVSEPGPVHSTSPRLPITQEPRPGSL